MKIRDGFNSFVIIGNVEFLIWTMQVITVKSESHKYDLDAEFFFKQGTNGNTSSTSHRYWRFAKRSFHGFGSCLISNAVNRRHIRLATMMQAGFHSNICWCNGLEMVDQQVGDGMRILVRY